MLYIFHVNVGRMLKFDMNLALSSVQNLKETIERLHGLPAANQVLLVSGGELLMSGSLVCSYSAGTDTNPIYMFITVEVRTPPQPWPSIEPDDLKEQIDRCLSLPATYQTVVARAQLAQQIYDLAREEEIICEKLVHEQHLQQQGWSAVIANMEDLTSEFRQRFDNFYKSFDEHLARRDEYLEFLSQFNEDLEKLSKIPILPGLMHNAEQEFHGFDEFLDNDDVFNGKPQDRSPSEQSSSGGGRDRSLSREKSLSRDYKSNENCNISAEEHKNRCLTLLQWISAKENHKPLRLMAEECTRGLELFDDKKIELLKTKVLAVIKQAQQEDIKEIKGLEDRLCGLEKLMFELKKQVKDQKELAAAFQHNQNRASNLNDASVLPDLCNSHKNHLLVMLQNQLKLRDFRRRISRAKDELASNLCKRLKYIVHIENSMSELDNNLLFYHRCLRRVQRHLSIIEQIHQAPSIYVTAVTEVVRRRIFSSAFLLWSSDLACDLLTIYNDEMMRRQEFSAIFEGHFLNTLFPGMDDMPPAYANEAPSVFDSSLPSLTKSDIDILSSYLPDLTSKIQLPDLGAVIEFFTLSKFRSGSKSQEKSSLSEGKMQSAGAGGIMLHRPIDVHPHLRDGFESETDTEEFEKVGQSPNERRHLSSTTTNTVATSTIASEKPEMMTASTSTEVITTHNTETLTEIELPQICPPKKPPRLSKLPSSAKCYEYSLPSIPEIHSPQYQSTESSSFSSRSEDPSYSYPNSTHNKINSNQRDVNVGHHDSKESQTIPVAAVDAVAITTKETPSNANDNIVSSSQQNSTSPLSPYPVNNLLIDNEFVNSEFYIDESLPSSLNDDYINSCNHIDMDHNIKSQIFLSANMDMNRLLRDDHDDDDDDDGGVNNIDELLKSTFGSRESLETVINLLQENLGTTRLEVENLKSLMGNMSQISRDSLSLLRKELESIRNETRSRKKELKEVINKIDEAWENVKQETNRKEKEMMDRLTVEHELETSDIRKGLNSKDNEIETLKEEKHSVEVRLSCELRNVTEELLKLKERNQALEIELQNALSDKSKAVAECQDKLKREYKTEIESLRCRFKLMTSAEKSPTDSLEKIERSDMMDRSYHESILEQTRKDFQVEKEKAIRDAVDQERLRWESLSSTIPILTKSEEILRKALEDKEKQVDLLQEQCGISSSEISQLQLKIQSLTTDDSSGQIWLRERISALNTEKNRLLEELNYEKSQKLKMVSSIKSLKSSTTGRYIDDPLDQTLSITVDSCSEGDAVFVIWNIKHRQYVIVQNSSTLYFLHGDSLNHLNLQIPPNGDNDLPQPLFCIGRVLGKEYCHAKKQENRYRVPRGTRFYRVRVHPIIRSPDSSRATQKHERTADAKTSSTSTSSAYQSMPVSRSTSTQHLTDSFAQTETIDKNLVGRDMTDSGVVEQVRSDNKERTISVTEEDEPLSLPDDRCRYISVSEEEERPDVEATSNQDCATPSLQLPTESSLEKDQDDSDEYRSLEAKDDLEFPSNVT